MLCFVLGKMTTRYFGSLTLAQYDAYLVIPSLSRDPVNQKTQNLFIISAFGLIVFPYHGLRLFV